MKVKTIISQAAFLTCVALGLSMGSLYGQRAESENACAKTLRSARSAYEQGRIEEVPDLVNKCLSSGFNDVERIEAYKLLILSHLYYDERAAAEDAMLRFLRIEPEYEINPVVDPPEFINLYNTFRTKPIFLIGGKAGGNLTFVNLQKNFSLDNTNNSTGTYTAQLGYQAGITADIPLGNKGFSIGIEANFIGHFYEYNKKQLGFSQLLFQEEQLWGEVPLLARYSFGKGNTKYYVQLGGAVSYLISSEATVERVDSVDLEVGNRSVSGPSIDLSEQREVLNYSITGGVGVRIKNVLGRGYLLADLRYTYGIPNIVNEEARYDNTELQYRYLYVDNDFSLSNAFISIGYMIPIYKPKVIRRKKRKALNE